MDASPSPRPAAAGSEPGQTDGRESAGSQPLAKFLDRIFPFRRRAEAGDPASETEEPPRSDRLSPAELAERTLMRNIQRMRDLRILDVMTPRADIVAVSEEAEFGDILQAFEENGFSRLPVYRETLDDPIGFVHLKDIALAYGIGRAPKRAFHLRDHIREALFVPPSMRVAALLQKMQGTRVHLALVIDEFGGVDGLVTIEDLVEPIVGDIEDEHDTEESALWRAESTGVYVLNARADLREFEMAEGQTLLPEDWEEDVDTFGGLVFMLTGRVPVRGEVISHPMGHEFQVIDADPRRIKRLRLTMRGAPPNGPSPPVREAAE